MGHEFSCLSEPHRRAALNPDQRLAKHTCGLTECGKATNLGSSNASFRHDPHDHYPLGGSEFV